MTLERFDRHRVDRQRPRACGRLPRLASAGNGIRDGLPLRFSGMGQLDRSSEDDLALLEAARLGAEVVLIVRGKVNQKSFRLADRDEELGFTATLKVTSVEAAELA
jgi:hypothetical protein